MINGISLDCLMDILIITHDNIPNIIPFAIEYENGIKTIATKELKSSAIFSPNLIDLIDSIINSPTYIKAGAVANAGIAVAVKTALGSMPAAERIEGLTARIYTIERKVVVPAVTSVFTSEPCSESLKNFSMSR